MKILSCTFNMDTACVELKVDDGSMIAIDTIAVENEIADNMYQRSELDYDGLLQKMHCWGLNHGYITLWLPAKSWILSSPNLLPVSESGKIRMVFSSISICTTASPVVLDMPSTLSLPFKNFFGKQEICYPAAPVIAHVANA